MNGIIQGTDYNERLGDEVIITSISLRMLLETGDASGSDNFNYFRILIIKDTQHFNSGSPPAVGDVLDFTSTNYLMSLPNWVNRKRFKFLYDKMHFVGQAIGEDLSLDNYGLGFVPQKYIKANLKMHLKTNYSGTSNGPAAISKNAIWILIITDSVITPHPTFDIYFRTKYRDA